MNFGTGDKEAIKSLIARLARSEKPGSAELTTHDVFLYPKGMAAINAVARAVFKTQPRGVDPQAIIYGWSYAETPKCLPMNGYARFRIYPKGTQEELEELVELLKSDNRISILFCEVPSNPLLESVDMECIHSLATEYNFIVACDQTLAAFANLDLLPYADILMDSLTKMFSGASNVMAGSVILNPQSKHYNRIHSALVDDFEDILFPLDAEVLAQNSADFEHRILRSNRNAMAIATLMSLHPSVERIYYPKMASSAALFEKYRRDTGGYGFLLSILFRRPSSAVCFYDALDVCKGPSIGTNFTLAVPYTQLAHFKEMDWAESCGVSKCIVRISVGLENEEQLLDRIRNALQVVEFGAQRDRGTSCQDIESSNGTAEHINYD
ncbi:putative cystathionine gamma-synthase [Penicillium oxalicum]|uniref:putative cystathionine gamma-synthase n=1 Tax=Penicillium oxalicum TaxID=69781 RepID=UPI0020B8BA32|nr:putative cystathionine gamma-synthase [Penicillium oxalicum]KAI2787834.1 putative cystathionine gamma-synthase [Penicillium oxalicum]